MATTAEQIQEIEDRLAALSEMRARMLGKEPISEDEIKRVATARTLAGTGGGAIPAGIAAGEQEPVGIKGIVPPEVVRYGVTAATALATGGASIPAQMGLGAVMNILSEASARGLEGKPVLDREGVRSTLASGLEGAVPFLPKAPGKSALLSGAGSMAAATVRKGEPLTREEAVYSGALPTATTLVGGLAAKAAGAGSEAVQSGAERAETIERIGTISPTGEPIRATLGEALPSVAGMEQRIEARVGGVKLKDFLSQRGERIAQAIESVTGQPVSNKKVAENILEAMNASEREDLLAQIGDLNSAYDALKATRDPIQRQIRQEAIQGTEQALESAIVNKFMGGMPRPTQYVEEARQLATGMQTAKDAFSTRANQLYAPLEQYMDVPGFRLDMPVPSRTGGAAASVQDQIQLALRDAPRDASGNIIPAFAGPLNRLQDVLSGRTPATLGELRTIREELYDQAESAGQAFGKPAQAKLRNVGAAITDTINAQAPNVIGAQPAADLLAANKFYAQFRPRFDRYGVSGAFASMERDTGTMAQQMIGKARVQGLDTDAVSNYVSLLDDLNKAGVAGTPSSAAAMDTVRTGLLNTAIDRKGRVPTIDFDELSALVNNLENQSPGSLKKLGLGDRENLNRLLDLREGLQGKPGSDQLLSLLKANQPVGYALAPAIIRDLASAKDVQPLINRLVDESVAGNKAAAEAVKNIRANEIQDLLLQASGSGELQATAAQAVREPRLRAMKDLSDPDVRSRYKATLGPSLFSLIEKQVIPGYSTIQKGSVAAGRSGVTVTGSAQEEALTSAGGMVGETIKGRPLLGVGGAVRKIVDLVGYATLSKIISQSAGSTGFRNAAQQLELLSNSLEGLSRPAAAQLLEDYALTGKLRAKQQLQNISENTARLRQALATP